MYSDSSLQLVLQRAIQSKVLKPVDRKGYVQSPADNLIEGVHLDQFEEDFRQGDGNEMRSKFCAAHSSAALAINTFAWFRPRERRHLLTLLGTSGANDLCFERKCPVFRGGRAPHLDVWIERDHEVVAIESKLTEYYLRTKPTFSDAYERLAPPGLAERCWWSAFLFAKTSVPINLDVAQLIKHYFGLRAYQQRQCQAKPIRFLYLFWEPLNWEKIPACVEHRKFLQALSSSVADSSIPLIWQSYTQLWESWSSNPALRQHAANLKARYEISL